jgi:hypothetical protein
LKKNSTAVAPGRAALRLYFCKIIIKLRGHPDVAVVARNDGGDMVNGLNVDEG